MRTINGWIATLVMVAVMTLGSTTFANATITIAEINGGEATPAPCTDNGIIIEGLGGIIIEGFGGIIIEGLTGIIIEGLSDKDGGC